jgi:hypothetical protein
MDFNIQPGQLAKNGLRVTMLAAAVAVASCGGGGSSSSVGNAGNKPTIPAVKTSEYRLTQLSLEKNSIKVSGDTLTVTVQAVDKFGGGAADQDVTLMVNKSSTNGTTINGPATLTTDENGFAVFSLRFDPTGVDTAQLLLEGVTISAVLQDKTGAVSTPMVRVIPVTQAGQTINNYQLLMRTNKTAVAAAGGTVDVTISVLDQNAGGVAGQNVSLAVSEALTYGLRIVGTSSKATDEKGDATFTVSYAPTSSTNIAELIQKGIVLGAAVENTTLKQALIVPVVTEATTDFAIAAYQTSTSVTTGGGSVDLTFRVTDLDGGALSGVPVQLTITEPQKVGASLSTSSKLTTDQDGLIRTTVAIEGRTLDHVINHPVNVTARILDVNNNVVASQPVTINVVGTSLTLDANKTVVNAGESLQIIATARDGKGNVIANADVAILNEAGAELSRVKTSSIGKVTFTLPSTVLVPNTSGEIVLSGRLFGSSTGVQQESSNTIRVASSSQDFSFTQIGQTAQVGIETPVGLIVKGKTRAEVVGQQVRVLTTQGQFVLTPEELAAGQKPSNIKVVTITDSMVRQEGALFVADIAVGLTSTSPGLANLSAFFGDNRITGQVNFVSQVPDKLIIQANDTTLPPNASTRVMVTVKDANDAPVEGVRVLFTRTLDASGGSLSSPEALTDASGVASVTYTAGSAPTPQNGVVVDAILENARPLSVNNSRAQLTVAAQAAFITMSYSNKLGIDEKEIFYQWPFSATVVDNIGRPVANKTVSLKLNPTIYYKGIWRIVTAVVNGAVIATWTRDTVTCNSEDTNLNAILDDGEDFNSSGKLEVSNPIAIIGGIERANGTVDFTTDSEGKFKFELHYGKNFAEWFRFDLTATTSVQGSEYISRTNVMPPVLVDDIRIEGGVSQRPNYESPYGLVQDCTNKD